MMDALDPYPGNLKKHEVTSDPRVPYGKEEQQTPLLSNATRLRDCEFTVTAQNAIAIAGFQTIGELLSHTDEELMKLRNVGRKTIGEIRRLRWVMQAHRELEDIRAKITSGELMVVKSVTYGDEAGLARNCSGCSHLSTLNESKYFNFCPGCGAKIIK